MMTAESLSRDAESHVLSFVGGDVDELRRRTAAAGGAYELVQSGGFLSDHEITEWWCGVGGKDRGDRYNSHLYRYVIEQAVNRLVHSKH